MKLIDLTDEIQKRYQQRNAKRPLIVGIDGFGGSGKTTLARQLEAKITHEINVLVIHMDNHIVERNRRYNTGHEEWYEYYFLQWDIDLLARELFEAIHRNESVLSLPFYERTTDHQSQKTFSLTPDTIVLVEGVFLQREQWKKFLDFIVFVHCPREIRYERVVNRDTYLGNEQAIRNKYNERYWPAEEYYMKTVGPQQIADKVYHWT